MEMTCKEVPAGESQYSPLLDFGIYYNILRPYLYYFIENLCIRRADCVVFMWKEDLFLCGLRYGSNFIHMHMYTHQFSSFFEKTIVLKGCCLTMKDAGILGLLRGRIQSRASDEA